MSPLRGVSPASVVARSGGRVKPLSSRREVPMNFATLNKKWFHEVNISVTIPSPTRDAHAQTHARTHARIARHDDEPDRTDVYIRILTCIRTRNTHAYKRPYIHSLILTRSLALSPSNPLSFSCAGPLFGVHHGGHARTREGPHTRTCKRAAHARIKNEGSERGIGRTARREGVRKRAPRADREREREGGTERSGEKE